MDDDASGRSDRPQVVQAAGAVDPLAAGALAGEPDLPDEPEPESDEPEPDEPADAGVDEDDSDEDEDDEPPSAEPEPDAAGAGERLSVR
jgi:hypothetical protein